MKKEEPYLKKKITVREMKYNPAYGDERICKCGHPYYRHFDTYENMAVAGCKYCQCGEFKEKATAESNAKLISAAPDLLESLQELQKVIETTILLTPTGELRNQLTEKNIRALSAIQKATAL